MALTPQQLQALFRQEFQSGGSFFNDATPGMGQDERNQWINQYGNGGTNWGDSLNWYGQNNAALNQQPQAAYQPGGIFNPGGGNAGAAANGQPIPDAKSGMLGNLPTDGSWNVNGNYSAGSPGGSPMGGQVAPSFTMPTSGSAGLTGWNGAHLFTNPGNSGVTNVGPGVRPTATGNVLRPNTNYDIGTPPVAPGTPAGPSTPVTGAPPGGTGGARPKGQGSGYSFGTYRNPWGKTTWQ